MKQRDHLTGHTYSKCDWHLWGRLSYFWEIAMNMRGAAVFALLTFCLTAAHGAFANSERTQAVRACYGDTLEVLLQPPGRNPAGIQVLVSLPVPERWTVEISALTDEHLDMSECVTEPVLASHATFVKSFHQIATDTRIPVSVKRMRIWPAKSAKLSRIDRVWI